MQTLTARLQELTQEPTADSLKNFLDDVSLLTMQHLETARPGLVICKIEWGDVQIKCDYHIFKSIQECCDYLIKEIFESEYDYQKSIGQALSINRLFNGVANGDLYVSFTSTEYAKEIDDRLVVWLNNKNEINITKERKNIIAKI